MRADNEVHITGIYWTTNLQKYDFKTINSNELFYLRALRNFYFLAILVVETEIVTWYGDSGRQLSVQILFFS